MLPRFLNFVILTPYFTRVLFKDSQAEFGKVTELYTYIALLMVVLTYGMETTYFRYATLEKDKNRVFSTIITSIIVTSLFFFLFVFGFTSQLSAVLNYAGEADFIRLVGSILAVEAITAIPYAKLRIENKAKRFALLKTIHILLNIGLMLSIYNLGPRITGSVDYLLNSDGIVSSKFIFIANLITSSFIFLLLLPEFRDYSIKKFDVKLLRPILSYGLPLMVSGLAGSINETLDRAIYRHVAPNKDTALYEVGIYGANYKLGALLYLFIQIYRYAAEPFFFNQAKEKDSKKTYSDLMNLFVGIIISFGLFVLLFLNYFKVFIDPSYHEGLFIVPYIVLAYILFGVLFNLSVWYKLSGQTKFALAIMSVGALLTVLINVFYIPIYKYEASAIGHVISATAMILVSYYFSRKHYKITYNLKRLGSYFTLGFCIYFVSFQIPLMNIIVDIILRSVLLLIFVIFVAWREDMLRYLKLVKRR